MLWTSVAARLGLIRRFGPRPSVTARRVKLRLKGIVPPPLDLAPCLYMTALATGALVIFSQPIPDTVWQVEDATIRWPIWAA